MKKDMREENVGKLQVKRSLGKFRHRREIKLKMEFTLQKYGVKM